MFEHFSRLFFGIIFPLFAIYSVFALRRAWKHGKASEQWPTIEGTILESRVEYDGDNYNLRIRYRYNVLFEIFEGDAVTYRGFSGDKRTLEGYVEKYPEQSKVLVYYDPADPENSVLEPGVDSSSYVLGGVGIVVLFTIGISLLIFELRHFLA